MDVERTIEFIKEQQAKHEAMRGEIDQLFTRGEKMIVRNIKAGRKIDKRIREIKRTKPPQQG